ncbi:MAG: hypothetical protein ACLUBG_05885 [Streptococcus agalactiae]
MAQRLKTVNIDIIQKQKMIFGYLKSDFEELSTEDNNEYLMTFCLYRYTRRAVEDFPYKNEFLGFNQKNE